MTEFLIALPFIALILIVLFFLKYMIIPCQRRSKRKPSELFEKNNEGVFELDAKFNIKRFHMEGKIKVIDEMELISIAPMEVCIPVNPDCLSNNNSNNNDKTKEENT